MGQCRRLTRRRSNSRRRWPTNSTAVFRRGVRRPTVGSGGEGEFAEYTKAGADPDVLADAVAGLSWYAGVNPGRAGRVATAMKGMKEPATEDQARREAAVEWLATEAGNGPGDRARAARLIGQFDDAFSAQLADKYPVLNAADAQFHDHNGRSASEHDLAAQQEQTAERADDEHLAVISAPTVADDKHLTASPEGAELAEDRDSDYGMAVNHEHTAADEQQYAQHAESDRSELAHAGLCRPQPLPWRRWVLPHRRAGHARQRSPPAQPTQQGARLASGPAPHDIRCHRTSATLRSSSVSELAQHN